MSESELYKNGGTIRTSNINKRNEQDAEELRILKAHERDNQLVGNAREEGFREGFKDFERRLTDSNQWNPIVEGSPQDIRMQDNVDRGLNYQEPQEPSILDSISGQLGKARDGLSDWFSREPEVEQPVNEQQSAFLKDQQFNQMQAESERAGLAELEQLLNKQRR